MQTQLDRALAFHQTALNLRAQRQQLIASNIANADTPNFKAKDMDFKAALNGALGQGGGFGRLALTATSSRHLENAPADPARAAEAYRVADQGAVDGNAVNMDVERAAFAENALQYEASVTFINGLLRSMQQAVQGQ